MSDLDLFFESAIFEAIRQEAERLGWQVWALDVAMPPKEAKPGYRMTDLERLVAPRQRVWMLRSPSKVPFVDGEPASSKSAEARAGDATPYQTLYTVPKRMSEAEAWRDLPRSMAKLCEHSRRL